MLIEILIAVAIVALVSGGIAVAVIAQGDRAKEKAALSEAVIIRDAANARITLESADGCPTVQELIREQLLERSVRTQDPWGKSYKIECSDRRVLVISSGRDRTPDTPDDIRIPPG